MENQLYNLRNTVKWKTRFQACKDGDVEEVRKLKT